MNNLEKRAQIQKSRYPFGCLFFCFTGGLEQFIPTARWAVGHRRSRRRCILTMFPYGNIGNESLPVYAKRSLATGVREWMSGNESLPVYAGRSLATGVRERMSTTSPFRCTPSEAWPQGSLRQGTTISTFLSSKAQEKSHPSPTQTPILVL